MKPLIGIQVGAISFLDEGFDEVTDRLQKDVGANALFVATHAFDRGAQGRQVHYRPWPGHGEKEQDDHTGGSYVTQHEEFYEGTVLGPYPAADKEVAGVDILEPLLPIAAAKDLKVYSFILENSHSGLTRGVPNWPKILQLDAVGRRDVYACLRNPDYVNWWLSLVEDQLKSYPLDGLMFGSERRGPLGNVLENGGFARDGQPYCFCGFCLDEGVRRGIDTRRAQEGYRLLYALARGEDDPAAPGDSSFIRFLRLLLQYPEVLAWDQLWHDGYRSLQKQIYGTVKFLAPDVQVGWHVWHHNSFAPLYRAQMDFTEIIEYSDFIKPVLYNNCGGYRLHDYIKNVGQGLFRGVDEQTLFDLYRQVLGYDEAGSFDDLPTNGLSPDYVRRESARAMAAVAGRAAVYPGIDVDVAAPNHVKSTTPEAVEASLKAAFAANVDGVVLSRKYSEMHVDNLAAIGRTLRESGLI